MDFWRPELLEKTFLLSKPPSLGYFVMAVLANSYTGFQEDVRILSTITQLSKTTMSGEG